MIKFFSKRLFCGVMVVATVIVIVSSAIYLTPVDATGLTFGQRTDNDTIESKRKALGLDKPFSTQLLYYFSDITPIDYIFNELQATEHYKGIGLWEFDDDVITPKVQIAF